MRSDRPETGVFSTTGSSIAIRKSIVVNIILPLLFGVLLSSLQTSSLDALQFFATLVHILNVHRTNQTIEIATNTMNASAASRLSWCDNALFSSRKISDVEF
jgi:hypothetical protein